jgi:hypothetical protein
MLARIRQQHTPIIKCQSNKLCLRQRRHAVNNSSEKAEKKAACWKIKTISSLLLRRKWHVNSDGSFLFALDIIEAHTTRPST